MNPLRILIADDHALVRTGFRLLLECDKQFDVVAEADSGEAAYLLYEETLPAVVIMDIAMPGIGGLEAIRRIVLRDQQARILALSAHEDLSHPRRALQAGALGYLTKSQAPEVLLDALVQIAAGKRIIDSSVAQRMAMAELSGNSDPLTQLSDREFEVFARLAQGKSVNQIAETLNLSPSTVGSHLYKLKRKLGVNNQAEMTLMAVRHDVIKL